LNRNHPGDILLEQILFDWAKVVGPKPFGKGLRHLCKSDQVHGHNLLCTSSEQVIGSNLWDINGRASSAIDFHWWTFSSKFFNLISILCDWMDPIFCGLNGDCGLIGLPSLLP
jgi:hypothetical protein